jgi:hypothetical protein
MASTWPWLNSWESWFQSPTSSQKLGSKKSPITPNYELITLKIVEKWLKNPLSTIH